MQGDGPKGLVQGPNIEREGEQPRSRDQLLKSIDVTSLRERALRAMGEPAFYGVRSSTVELEETHVSLVFLVDDRAYKVKKPLRLPFLDQSTLERRRHLCGEEVRLNRRLAPDVYIGVRSIVRRGDRFVLGEPEEPDAIEYVVEMRRLPKERTLERLVLDSSAEAETMALIARRVAGFHAEAQRGRNGIGGPTDVKAQIDENLRTVLPEVGSVVDRHTFKSVERFSSAFVLSRRKLLEARLTDGRVREGHGDLRAEHIVLEDGRVTIYDCVEFDERLRFIDVAADLAFLVVDLERLGSADLAAELQCAYTNESGDSQLGELLPFYACYRAWVRAKVTCLRMRQIGSADSRHGELEREARLLFGLSQRFAWRARLPLVLVLCGVAASGKSALAAGLARRSGLTPLSSDAIRKSLAGVPLDERAGEEVYDVPFTSRTYAELAGRARREVEERGGALVDATFVHSTYRKELLAALMSTRARVLFCECQAPTAVLRQRSRTRERRPERGSDATWEIVQRQLSEFEPLHEIPASDHLAHRTDRPLEESLDEIDAWVSRVLD